MKSIEISTSHNIIFKYQLAPVMHRCFSTLLDVLFFGIYNTIVAVCFGWNSFLFYLIGVIPGMLYHLIFESLMDGQSPGKKILKIKVVTLRGTTPALNDYFLRWIFRLVDIAFSIGSLGIITILSSEKNQRIGDLIAGTTVISLGKADDFGLAQLTNLNNQNIQINYPGLRNFSDKDMLLLKHAILRYQEFETPENRSVLRRIGLKIFERLDIPPPDQINVQFLNQLLNEYILLTR
jgi:uncharacterized RDD family membrane protein YckC